jgi:hypothetical protein
MIMENVEKSLKLKVKQNTKLDDLLNKTNP